MRSSMLVLLLSLLCRQASAEPAHAPSPAAALLGQLLHDNDGFVHAHPPAYFDRYRDEQHPRATVVACGDSRFQTRDIEAEPDGDLFEVRNIGNQIDTSEGSVEFGVRVLHTPVLLIVGHVTCGAVKAALGNYQNMGVAVRRELDGLHGSLRTVPDGTPDQRWAAGVRANVSTQVAYAMKEYAEEVRTGALTIVGAVYDFRDDLGHGRGRLNVIDINGEHDPKRLADLPIMRQATAASH